MKGCIVVNCCSATLAKGLCRHHYDSFRRAGFGARRRATKPGDVLKFVKDVVLPYRGSDCLLWPFAKEGKGYAQIVVDGKTSIASRYICELAHGAPPSPEFDAAHRCGVSSCVSPHHIRWLAKSDNCAEKKIHGTEQIGENNPFSKLTLREVQEIIECKGKVRQVDLATRYGVSQPTISAIQRGKNWGSFTSHP